MFRRASRAVASVRRPRPRPSAGVVASGDVHAEDVVFAWREVAVAAEDVSPKLLRRYGPMQTLCRVLAAHNDDLAHPTLTDALRARDAG